MRVVGEVEPYCDDRSVNRRSGDLGNPTQLHTAIDAYRPDIRHGDRGRPTEHLWHDRIHRLAGNGEHPGVVVRGALDDLRLQSRRGRRPAERAADMRTSRNRPDWPPLPIHAFVRKSATSSASVISRRDVMLVCSLSVRSKDSKVEVSALDCQIVKGAKSGKPLEFVSTVCL